MSSPYEYLTHVDVTEEPGNHVARIKVDRIDPNGFPSIASQRDIHLHRDLDVAEAELLGLETAVDMLRAALVIRRDEATRKARARQLAEKKAAEGSR